MISKPNPNRGIATGDCGVNASSPKLTRKERERQSRQTVDAIKVRMKDWSPDFLRKVERENNNQAWRQAAQESLKERGETGTNQKPTIKKKRFIPDGIKQAWAAKHRALDVGAAAQRWGIRG